MNLNQRALETENIRSLLSSPMLFRAFSIDSLEIQPIGFPYLSKYNGWLPEDASSDQSINREGGRSKKEASL